MDKVKALQIVCPRGMYGAERWILALNKNLRPEMTASEIAVISEDQRQQEVVNQFKAAGQIVHEIKMPTRFSLSAIRDFGDLIRDRRVDILHSHGYKADIIGWLAAKQTGIKILSTPHGFGEPKGLKHKLYIGTDKWLLRRFDRVAPLSLQLEHELLQAGVPKDRIAFIRNAVDIDEVDSCTVEPGTLENEHKIIGFIGQLIPRKKVDHLIDVFDRVWAEDKNTELHIIGDGESRLELESYAQTLPSKEAIKFLGYRPDRMRLLKSFSLFSMASSDEGIPRCLMEALTMRVPVTAYDIPGVDQLIIDEETGLLAPFGDKSGQKSNWQRLLYDGETADRLVANGRRLIEEKFSPLRMAREYESLYQSMLRTSPALQ